MLKLWNDAWEFSKNSTDNFKPQEIPHDWLIWDTNNLYEKSVGYYRKKFNSELTPEQRMFVIFDGVYMDCSVTLNGIKIGEWKHGYTAFEIELTPHLHSGENVLLVQVNYDPPNTRWYSGAGIYRNVQLRVTNSARFITDGIYVTPSKNADGSWDVNVTAEIESELPYEVRHTISGEDGLTIRNPKLWDIGQGNLYTLKSELLIDNSLQDTAETRFGLREIGFEPNSGFYLNGRNVKLNGVCLHHDHGALGSAFSKNAARRQLDKMREMGVNSIRTSHNPPAREFMQLCDEMGFVVVSECFDCWENPKTENDYARFFPEWHERDVSSWVRRDRNCPSVVLWSLGNEISDTNEPRGLDVMNDLANLVRSHDPNHHAELTLCSCFMPNPATESCVAKTDVKIVGYNYAEYLYAKHHEAHPDWVLFGSETGSTVQSRNIYHFPLSKPSPAEEDLQCSSLGNSTVPWGAKSVEKFLSDDRDAPYSIGQFVWTGTDYIGEPTPYQTKSSYFGHMDTALFAKDSYYLIQAAWTDYKTSPMVHVLPYWDWSPGQLIDVRAYTNCPYVEIFINGTSLGKDDVRNVYVSNRQAVFEYGSVVAVAYDENGKELARAERRSFGETVGLKIESESYGDLTFHSITAVDKDGHYVENSNRRVWTNVTGGELLGLDNGDSSDFEQYKTDNRRLFGGKLLAITRGAAKLTVVLDETDIPVRKLEISIDDSGVSAKILPENATHTAVKWNIQAGALNGNSYPAFISYQSNS